MLQYDSDKNAWSGLLVDINNARKGIVNVGEEADKFFSKTKSWNPESLSNLSKINDVKFDSFIKQQGLADESLIAFLKDTNYAKKDLANYQLYLKDTGKATTTFATLTKKAGNVLKSFGASLVSMGVSWLAGQAFGLIIKGLDNLFHAEEKAAEKAREVADSSRETARAHEEEREQLNTLIERYEELAQSENFDSQTRDEIKQIQEDIVGLVGDEAKGIDLVNGNLDDQIAKLREINAIKAGETVSDYEKAYKDAANETKDAVKHQGNWADNWTNSWLGNDNVITFDFFGDDKARNKGLEIIDKAWKEKGYGSAYVDEVQMDLLGLVWDSFSKLELNKDLNDTEKAEAIQAAVEALEKAEGYDYNDSELWRKLVEIRNSMTGQDGTVTKQKNAANDLLDAILVQAVRSGKDVSSADEYQKYIDEVVKTISENETVKEAIENGDLKLEDVNSVVTDYLGNMKKYSDYTKDAIIENHDKMTVSLSELEGTSDKIKTLGSAFKELSDDGYITTKTLGEIKTATGLADDEWKSYETTLLNAKRGSSKFDQAMSELTYKILENSIGTDKLANASESYIASVLRENGVTNANAVAHDIATKAKAEQHVQNQKVASSTEIDTKKLMENAIAAGVDEAAYRSLLAQEILFNNNNLDSKQKCEEILEIASAAGVATVQMSALNSEIAKVAGEKIGSGARTEYAESLGGTVVHEKDRGKDGKGKGNLYISSNGKEFENFEDYSYYQTAYNQNKLISSAFDSNLTIPNYSGATSGSGSTKNSALDNYLKDAENRYKIHQDETKYIQELQYAYDNLTKEEKERLDITGKINEAYRDLADNRIKDLEHQIDLTKELKGENANVVAQLNEIQRVANEEANRLRSMGYDNNSNEIQSLQKTWWDAEKEKLDWRFNISKEWIEQRNTFGDWHLFKDSEVKAWERVIKWLKDEYPHAVDEIKEAEESLFEARKEQLDKITDFTSSYFDSHKTLLQSYFDVTNSIAEAQHEINKELEASKTMYEYLDEETRKLLFNQEDYYKLSEELYDLQYEADKLQRGYEQALNNATLDTIEEITSQYEMQYEMMMKKYEIAKAELDVAKKRQQLDNVLNERNVRMLIDGQWQWVANTQDVIDAQNELADAKYEAQQARLQKQQTDSLNDLTAQQDKLGTVINKFESGVIDMSTAVDKIKNMFNELPTAMAQAISQLSSAKGGNSYSSSSSGGSSLGGSYRNDPSVIADLNRQMDENSKAWHSATSQKEKERLHNTNKMIAGYLGLKDSDFDSSTGKWKKHADGTRHTPGGWTLMGEEPEMYITANGHLIPINQPTIGNIDSGGVVFNQEQMANLRSMWDLSNIASPVLTGLVDRQVASNTGGESINFYGDIQINQPHDYNDFVRQLTHRVRQKTV